MTTVNSHPHPVGAVALSHALLFGGVASVAFEELFHLVDFLLLDDRDVEHFVLEHVSHHGE